MVVVLSAFLARERSTPVEKFDACLHQLESLACAFEMYSTDHRGRYPSSLDDLIPTYLPERPVCPSAGYDTYTDGIELGPEAPHNDLKYQDYFFLCCSGHHHLEAGPNSPRLDGITSVHWRNEDEKRRAYGYRGGLSCSGD